MEPDRPIHSSTRYLYVTAARLRIEENKLFFELSRGLVVPHRGISQAICKVVEPD